MDDELIRRAQAGDHGAFHDLVQRYATLASRTARVLLPERMAAEDAVQEAWLDAWRHLPRFERGRPFRPWLLTLVRNRCRMATRRAAPPTVPLEDGEQLASRGELAGGLPDQELAAALASLPPDQQRVVALRFFADLELAEIALVTGMRLGTVKSRLHRALGALRLYLEAGQPALVALFRRKTHENIK